MDITDTTQVGVQQVVPLLAVKSLEASLRFYVDGLGVRRANQWIHDGIKRGATSSIITLG